MSDPTSEQKHYSSYICFYPKSEHSQELTSEYADFVLIVRCILNVKSDPIRISRLILPYIWIGSGLNKPRIIKPYFKIPITFLNVFRDHTYFRAPN
jgi:hypothetical protein